MKLHNGIRDQISPFNCLATTIEWTTVAFETLAMIVRTLTVIYIGTLNSKYLFIECRTGFDRIMYL